MPECVVYHRTSYNFQAVRDSCNPGSGTREQRPFMRAFKVTIAGLGAILLILSSVQPAFYGAAQEKVKVSRGSIEWPTYEFSGRELEPPLFSNSTVEGKYPLPQFIRPYKPGGPKPESYQAIFLENEYL